MDHFLVMPVHDPKRIFLPHLERVTPAIKQHFTGAVVSVASGENARLLADPFYHLVTVASSLPVGAQFHALYRHAAETCPPEAVLHLCFADRLVFQVAGEFRESFFDSIRELRPESLPLIFQRSPAAWATHPRNYREIESAISTVARWVFGRTLDIAWCHVAVEAGNLKKILPAIRRTDMSMMAEIILQLHKDIKTEDVDWLAWEDPFILGREAGELMREREESLEETRKRLAYALPMMDVLYKAGNSNNLGI